MDVGLLILRIVPGALMFGHGAQKLFGWFGGHGMGETASFLQKLGFRPGRMWGLVNGISEALGGLMLTLGLLTPLGAAIVIGVMLVAAVAAHGEKGLWNTQGGYELPLVYAVIAAALAFIGPGASSLDRALGLSLAGWPYGVGAVSLGVAAGFLTLGLRRVLTSARREPPREPRRAA